MSSPQSTLTHGSPLGSASRGLLVLLAGVVTTVVTLALSWGIERASDGRFTVMGLYVSLVLPAGAMIVGMGAASGYAGAALVTGVRIRGPLLAAVLGITLASYVAMHYVEFLGLGPVTLKATGQRLTFAQYYDLTTRRMQFRLGHAGAASDAAETPELGAFGYLARVLEVGAFGLGALATPLLLRGRRYCDPCQRYHQVYTLAVVPAAVKARKGLGRGPPEVEAAHAGAARAADAVVNGLANAICDDDAVAFDRQIAPLLAGSKASGRRLRRVEVRLSRCRACGRGVIAPTLVTVRNQHGVVRKPMWSAPVEPAFADALRPR